MAVRVLRPTMLAAVAVVADLFLALAPYLVVQRLPLPLVRAAVHQFRLVRPALKAAVLR